jgi:O-antigen/teichoic acid export membrane protein
LTFKKSIVFTFLSKVSVSALGLIMVVLISRNLGADGRGHLSLFVSSIALVQLFSEFGSSSVIINLSYKINQRKLWLSSLIWISGICFLSFGVLQSMRHLPYYYNLIPFAAFLFSAINLNQMLLMGNQEVKKRNASLLIQPLSLLILFIGFYFYAKFGIISYPLALFIALLISFSVSLILVRKYLIKKEKRFAFEPLVLKQGLLVQGSQAVQFFNYRLNFFLVAFLINDAALGLYSNAIVICESVWILGHSIGQIQHMKILNTTDEKEQLTLTTRLVYVNIVGTAAICLVLALIPNSFWVFLFSKDFAQMGSLFVYLFPGVMAFSISNIYNHYFHAKSEFKRIFKYNSFGLILGLTSAIVLMPLYGIEGACLSWSFGLIISMVFYLSGFKKISLNIFEKN